MTRSVRNDCECSFRARGSRRRSAPICHLRNRIILDRGAREPKGSYKAGNFYFQMASERDRGRVLAIIKEHAKRDQRVFIGVIDPIDPRVETPDEVRDRVLQAAEYIAPGQLGTCDDCGFSPFGDDTSTARETAFEKIRARVVGTEMAAKELGV